MLVKAMEKKQGSRIRKKPRKQRVIPKGCCFSENVRNVRGLWIKNCNTKARFFSKYVQVFEDQESGTGQKSEISFYLLTVCVTNT